MTGEQLLEWLGGLSEEERRKPVEFFIRPPVYRAVGNGGSRCIPVEHVEVNGHRLVLSTPPKVAKP